MKHPELKPCPKCGSDNLFYGYRYDCTKVLFPRRWLIACIDCDYESHEDGGEKTRGRAMKVHNRRSTMSKERIEEMAQDIYNALPDYEHNARDCRNAAEELFAKGYRKQSEGEWVWKTKIEPQAQNRLYCSVCDEECLAKNNYYVKSNFCHNCGAKMKGV
jgi:hypothetical protein